MVAQVGNLQVRVGADITGLKTGMAQAQAQVRGGVRGMQKQVSDLQLTFKEMSTNAGRSLRLLGALWAAELGAGAVLKATDAFKQLSAQLRLATSQYGSFAQANKDVRDIAERTRSDLLATAELYSALQRNSDQFGASQAQVARVTQTVAEAFKISGATADEASNATRQLVQAFQSGRLQGDEFRSVLENAPRLARLLADSLDTTIGKLRTMSKEGELTSDILVRAFSDKKFTAELDKEFEQLPVTFDQAMGQVYNTAVLALGAFDQGGQFSNSLANFITGGVKGFSDLEASAYSFGQGVSELFTAIDVVRTGLGSLETSGVGSFLNLTDATFTWRDALATTLGVIDGVANAFANLYNAPGNLIRMGIGQQPINNPVNLRGDFIRRTDDSRATAFRRRIFAAADPNAGKTPPPFHPEAKPGKGGGTYRPPHDRSADVAYQLQREQMQADADILHAKLQLAGSSEQRAEISLQLIKLEHDMQAAEIDDRVRKAKQDLAEKEGVVLKAKTNDATRKRAAQEVAIAKSTLDEVTAQASILKAKNDEKTAIELRAFVEERLTKAEQANFEAADQQRSFALDALHAADGLATTQADHRRIQLQILDSEINQKRLELQHEKDLAIRNGATAEEIKVIQDKIDNLGAERAQGAAGINRNTEGPLEAWKRTVPQTAAEINEALQSIEVEGLDGLSDAITDVITGTESLKDAFHQLAVSILADLLKMTIRMLIFKALQAALGGGGTPTISADAFGTGNNAMFASGGFVSGPGSATSDSIPAMLSDGEYVVNADAVRSWLPLLEAINGGRAPRMKGGGVLGAMKFISPVALLQSQGLLRFASAFSLGANELGTGFASGGLVSGLPIPRASMGGGVAIAANDLAIPPATVVYQTFDLNGAVVTSDLLRQMDEKSQQAAEAGARMGVNRILDLNQRTYGKAMST